MDVEDGYANAWVNNGGHWVLKCVCTVWEVIGVLNGVCGQASVEVGWYPSDIRVGGQREL